MTEYILVEVCDREIVVHKHNNLFDAQQELRNSFNEVSKKHNDIEYGADCYLSDDNMFAWITTHNENFDWQIEKIN